MKLAKAGFDGSETEEVPGVEKDWMTRDMPGHLGFSEKLSPKEWRKIYGGGGSVGNPPEDRYEHLASALDSRGLTVTSANARVRLLSVLAILVTCTDVDHGLTVREIREIFAASEERKPPSEDAVLGDIDALVTMLGPLMEIKRPKRGEVGGFKCLRFVLTADEAIKVGTLVNQASSLEEEEQAQIVSAISFSQAEDWERRYLNEVSKDASKKVRPPFEVIVQVDAEAASALRDWIGNDFRLENVSADGSGYARINLAEHADWPCQLVSFGGRVRIIKPLSALWANSGSWAGAEAGYDELQANRNKAAVVLRKLSETALSIVPEQVEGR